MNIKYPKTELMVVLANETKTNIDHLVMDEVFDQAVSEYDWDYE